MPLAVFRLGSSPGPVPGLPGGPAHHLSWTVRSGRCFQVAWVGPTWSTPRAWASPPGPDKGCELGAGSCPCSPPVCAGSSGPRPLLPPPSRVCVFQGSRLDSHRCFCPFQLSVEAAGLPGLVQEAPMGAGVPRVPPEEAAAPSGHVGLWPGPPISSRGSLDPWEAQEMKS